MGLISFFNDTVARVKTALTYTLEDAALRDDVRGVRRLMGETAPAGHGIPAYNAHCLLVAAENGSYNAMREMLTLSAQNSGYGATTPMSFALGKDWSRFEELAKTTPVISLAITDYRANLEAAFARIEAGDKVYREGLKAGMPEKQAMQAAVKAMHN